MTGLLLFSVLLLAWSSASSSEEWTSCRESSSPQRFILFQENVCNLHLIADPTLWRHFKYERFGAVLTDEKASQEIEKFFAGHVSALKRIFLNTEFRTFDGRETWRGLDLEMDRSTIMTDTTAKCNTPDANALCSPDLSLTHFRFLISSVNHDEHCLAIFFTYRYYSGLVSGTKLTFPFTFTPGAGICDRHVGYTTEKGTVYNSGNFIWVTLLSTEETLTERASHTLLAHTVGHALGSPNDDGPDCVPDADDPAGNYLMYEAVPNLKENTEKLSSCSKDGIAHFLSGVVYSKHGRHNCLKPSVSGRGLLHGFVSPEICSGKDDPDLSDHDFKPNDEF